MFECRLGNNRIVLLIGRFDASQTAVAQAVLDGVTHDCVVDCRDLSYISSAGISVILSTYKRLHDVGKTLTLINANEHISRVLHYAGLTELFGIQ
jgi:anti-anti-sigma factor